MDADTDAYMKRLSGSFVHLRQSGKLCDTVLVTADQRLLAHSIVLAAASPIFCATFQSCTVDGCMTYQLQLDGLDGRLVETVLDCIYSGSVTPLTLLSSIVDRESALEICEQLGINWMVTDIKGASNRMNLSVQDKGTERSQTVSGCYQQAGTDQRHSVRSSENDVVFDNSQLEICTGNAPVLHGDILGNDVEAPLLSAVKAKEEQLCLYVCDVCTQRFSTRVTLRQHRQHHKGCATCANCGHSFYSTAVLRHHSQMQCMRKKVTCNICHGSFDGWPSLSRHTATTHRAAHLCLLCGQAFSLVGQLSAHRTVHATNIYQCRICAQIFHVRSLMKRHVMKHVMDSHDECISVTCMNRLSGDGLILKSQFSQDNQDAATSWLNGDTCNSGYGYNDVIQDIGINYQLKQATKDACIPDTLPAVCTYSQAQKVLALLSVDSTLPAVVTFSSGHTAERQIVLCSNKQSQEAVKAVSPEKVTCGICSRTFKRLSDLHVHMQRHTGEMRYKCSVCSRPFRKSGTLERHMRIHTGERPYICETCGKSYKLLFHLRLHRTVHSSDRPFSCEICGKSFQSASSLKKHRFVHSGVKPFPCPICLRLFNRCGNMRAHMRIHEGVRQHDIFDQEQVCRKRFGNAASFQAHFQTHAHQIGLDVGETITAVDSANSFGTAEVTYAKIEKQEADDVYVALPLGHFEDFDVS